MGTLYTGVPANVSLASAAQATVPADADVDSAATFTVGMQKTLDYVEALRLISSSGWQISEGFESATFPPTAPNGVWAAPSPRFGSDLAYVRDTGTPLVGAASANRPSGQTASTNSSLGLTVYFPSPSRLAFVFQVICNVGQSDHLDFFVDGVLTAEISSRTGPTTEAARFVTDVLPEGPHTFDWRFVRGASASVGSEQAKIDTVEVISESAWYSDFARVGFFDDFESPGGTIPGSPNVGPKGMVALFGANAGGSAYNAPSSATSFQLGAITLGTAATAIGDLAALVCSTGYALIPNGTRGLMKSRNSILEVEVEFPSVAQIFAYAGMSSDTTNLDQSAIDEFIALLDTSLGTSWRTRSRNNGGTVATIDTGVVPAANTPYRLRLMLSSAPVGAMLAINGKSIPAAGAGFSMCTSTVPGSAVGMAPKYRVMSRIAAAVTQLTLNFHRILSLRA